MRPLPLLAALFSTLALSPAVQAKLEFEHPRLEVPVPAGAESVEALFRFRNTGTDTVEVTATRADCGCTVPQLDKYSLAPGESGTVKVVFTVGERTGRQEKRVYLETNDGRPPTELLLTAEIPLTVQITPQILIWNVGEPITPRSAAVTVNAAAGISISRVEWLGEGGFKHELEPTEVPGTYRLVVTPQDTSARCRARLDVHTRREGEGAESKKSIYVSVR